MSASRLVVRSSGLSWLVGALFVCFVLFCFGFFLGGFCLFVGGFLGFFFFFLHSLAISLGFTTFG